MFVKQISVFVENKKGRLAEVTSALIGMGIDILAISIADTTNFGILRMIVNKPDEAISSIKEAGYTVNITDVIALRVPDEPGGLNKALLIMAENDISVEYLYSFARTSDKAAIILFRVEEPDEAIDKLKKLNCNVLSHDEVYNF